MSKSSIFLQPAYSLTGEVFDKVNLISGSSFDNGLVSLFFDGEIVRDLKDDTYIQCKLYSIDLDMTFYVHFSEVERITGIEFCHLDERYLSYLISQHLLKYGISFEKIVTGFLDFSNKPVLVKSQLSVGNHKLIIYVDLDKSIIDRGGLSYRKNKLPGTLRFKTSLNLFDTVLDTTEIASLTTDDVVLVYPK
ncbi:dimethyladenosine transferase [Vibrio cholerae]|uniref:dimethyladenosine transferase n=1 Tax=Vibrio cholerae TaxID=666 RepID=UPI002F9FC696|nr:dimethyladenosine transferase [Vibrio cholerae]EKF9674873.1 dimethyladenosine transferase [Vibrio cholerae]